MGTISYLVTSLELFFSLERTGTTKVFLFLASSSYWGEEGGGNKQTNNNNQKVFMKFS